MSLDGFSDAAYTHRQLNLLGPVSNLWCKIIFWMFELHTNFWIRHTVQCGGKLCEPTPSFTVAWVALLKPSLNLPFH